MSRQEELQPRGCHRLCAHDGFLGCVNADVGHVAAEDDQGGGFVDAAQGAQNTRLDLGCEYAFGLHVGAHFGGERLAKALSGGGVLDHGKTPRLTVVRRGGKRRSGEQVLNNGIRHGVRFEAADGAAGAQEVAQVSVRQSGSA